jgi:hypothetical protein
MGFVLPDAPQVYLFETTNFNHESKTTQTCTRPVADTHCLRFN